MDRRDLIGGDDMYIYRQGKQYISETLRDLVPFAQFKKRGKHPYRSVTFRKVYS